MFKRLQLFFNTSLHLEDNIALGSALGIIKACNCLEKQASVQGKSVFPPAQSCLYHRSQRKQIDIPAKCRVGITGQQFPSYLQKWQMEHFPNPSHPSSPPAAAAITFGETARLLLQSSTPDLVSQLQPVVLPWLASDLHTQEQSSSKPTQQPCWPQTTTALGSLTVWGVVSWVWQRVFPVSGFKSIPTTARSNSAWLC